MHSFQAHNPFSERQDIVLVGGCFDLLHPGHLAFLQSAKALGKTLIVLLESDAFIRKYKGTDRPIHPQSERAEALCALEFVDGIICLESTLNNAQYDQLILAIKPAIIATTKGDQYLHHKKRQGKLCNAKVIEVIERDTQYSTTQLIKEMKSV